jgi:ankyrin repeat protein
MNIELYRCALSGNLKRFKELVKGGTNIDEITRDGMTALLFASRNGRFEMVVYLVERGANVTRTAGTQNGGMTALQFASVGGDLPMVKYLLEHGAGITQRAKYGKTGVERWRYSSICCHRRAAQT